jgi:hypothetical protein
MDEAYIERLAYATIEDLSDDHLNSYLRYTDGLPLKDYEKVLDLCPVLVNLVSLADALPLDGSPLPFSLKKIAARCGGAIYFAPRRFTAVQIAFDEPRSRVLLFRAFAPSPALPRACAHVADLRRGATLGFDRHWSHRGHRLQLPDRRQARGDACFEVDR